MIFLDPVCPLSHTEWPSATTNQTSQLSYYIFQLTFLWIIVLNMREHICAKNVIPKLLNHFYQQIISKTQPSCSVLRQQPAQCDNFTHFYS